MIPWGSCGRLHLFQYPGYPGTSRPTCHACGALNPHYVEALDVFRVRA